MATRTSSPSSPLLVLCPTLRRPTNVARLKESYYQTATDASELRFLTGEQTCVEKMNAACAGAIAAGYEAVMFVGDDHVFETPKWDEMLLSVLSAAPGIVWPDDCNRYAHPITWAMSVEVIAALGWFMLPTQRHYYVDDAVYSLAVRAGIGTWREDVKVPHLHYRLTGGPDDEVYRRAQGWLAGDRESYWRWLHDDSQAVVEKLRGSFT